ncbi:TAP-like protein-domain-containing protein [Podospora didyma]|uniref:TAP-like protein-domain-containing protein n=1 Tax=Podospora didyma TaxID=330526 RepID=A0AAE0U5H7_9PEZI|nr:TAP-like protein-domain-containing protein [Podospora didyma]
MRTSPSTSTTWLLIGVLTAGSSSAFIQQQHHRRQLPVDFNWTSIIPSQDLQYHACYDSYKCARLQVPLDWAKAAAAPSSFPASGGSNASSSNSWAAIAIITLPATVPNTDPSFGGTVLINPGGPGGSGTGMALDSGVYLRGILDSEDRHYEILGFDPRGMALSTPSAECYSDSEGVNRLADAVQQGGMPPVTAGNVSLNLHFAAAKGGSSVCAEHEAAAGSDSIFSHMSTASVARDMLEIVERADALRSSGSGRNQTKPARLQYLGVSYGTFLGNTFASMFPDRVERMVLDGVVDAGDFLSGRLSKNLNDAELVVDRFYQTCFQAGTSACPLRQEADTSAVDIRSRVDAYIHSLEIEPLSAVFNGRARLVTSLVVRQAIRVTLYTPICSYANLAAALASSIFAGNHTLLLSGGNFCQPPPLSHTEVGSYAWAGEAAMGVFCGDSAAEAGDRDNVSFTADIVSFLTEQSPTTGEPWLRFPASCSGWSFKPPYTFRGPFGSAVGNSSSSSSSPMLILSNRHDHATPLANAYALSQVHGGSAVVVQESFGHSALLTATSNCTAGIVREYFKSGTLPANGTVCEQNSDCEPAIPFKACPGFSEFGL